jgi:hypothetical protein
LRLFFFSAPGGSGAFHRTLTTGCSIPLR